MIEPEEIDEVNVNTYIQQEAIKKVPLVMDVVEGIMYSSKKDKDRLDAAKEILDLAGSVTKKDNVNWKQGVSTGFQLSSEAMGGVLNGLGNLIGMNNVSPEGGTAPAVTLVPDKPIMDIDYKPPPLPSIDEIFEEVEVEKPITSSPDPDKNEINYDD